MPGYTDEQYGQFLHQCSRLAAKGVSFETVSATLEDLYRQTLELEGREGEFLYLTLPSSVLRQSLDYLGLEARTHNALHHAGIETLEDLLEYSAGELLEYRNLGPKSVKYIEEVLQLQKLHLSRHGRGLDPPPGDRWVSFIHRRVLYSRLHRVPLRHLADGPYFERSNDSLVACLGQYGIKTVGQLIRLDVAAFRELPLAGCKIWRSPLELDTPLIEWALNRVRQWLARPGLSLRGES